MPLPKNSKARLLYREKMSRIAKAKGFGKWMKGKKLKPSTIEKMRIVQQRIGKDPAERKRRSARAKKLGYGLWMKGRKLPKSVIKKIVAHKKGKTYTELYGLKKALELKKKMRQAMLRFVEKNPGVQGREITPKGRRKLVRIRKGKTYEEIYGPEKAKAERKKRYLGQRRRWAGHRRAPGHWGPHYSYWRKQVLKRDKHKCSFCNAKTNLQAHHVRQWAKYPKLRYKVSNGITVCRSCHIKVHNTRGENDLAPNKKV